MGKQDLPKGGQEKPKKKEKGPLSPEDYAKKHELAEREAETRGERLEKLRAKVNELFPNPEQAKLREEIEASFDVPQVGDYHNEGMLMDTHLDHILETIDAIADGKNEQLAELPASVQELLRETIGKNRQILERYTLLHDISKNDLLRLTTHEEAETGAKLEDVAYTSADWQALVPEDVRRDPVKLLEFMQGPDKKKKIVSISYFNKTGDKTPTGGKVAEGKLHGGEGAAKISRLGGLDPESTETKLLMTAIGSHELALGFSDVSQPGDGVDLEKFANKLSGLTEEEFRFALTVNFLDVASSLSLNQKPNLTGFMNILESKRSYEAYIRIKEKLNSNSSLDKKKVEAQLNKLFKGKKPVNETAELARLEKECRPTEYDPGKLNEMLQELVGKNALTAEEASEVAALILADNQPELGKKYGKKMGQIRAAMSASEKKD
jgi:hypothetical protein